MKNPPFVHEMLHRTIAKCENTCYTEFGSATSNRKEYTTMTIGDKCPYCGRELLSGYLQSARQIIWSQDEKSISFRADEDGDMIYFRFNV